MKMKRLLSLLLCALLCIGLMSAVAFASGEKYTVTYQLTGMTADGQPLEAANGTTLLAISLTTMQGYEAPDAITVKIGDTELKEGRDYTAWVMGGGTWIAVNIAGACITGDITITAEATAVNVSDNANLSAIEYYDGGLWKNIQLTDEQIQDALTPEGANIIMSHGCLDNQYIMLYAVPEDAKAAASYDMLAQLEDGKCTTEITVTAEDRITTKNYILHFSIDPVHTWENGKCTICGYECRHTGGKATCITPAVCDICGQSYGSVDPDNHSGRIVWTQTATTHSSAYDCCGAAVVAEESHEWTDGVCGECEYECQHTGGTATCTTPAVCTICAGEYGSVNASNHTNLVKTEATPATHMTKGNTEYWYCDGCDKYFSDEAGTTEIALNDTVVPKLTEHTADNTGWHTDAASHWNTCACGAVFNVQSHTFTWVTDREATATEAGSRHEQCTVCGYAKLAEAIPATGTAQPGDTTGTGGAEGTSGGNTSPKTADPSVPVLAAALLTAACAGASSVLVYSRKKHRS